MATQHHYLHIALNCLQQTSLAGENADYVYNRRVTSLNCAFDRNTHVSMPTRAVWVQERSSMWWDHIVGSSFPSLSCTCEVGDNKE